jgi:hypothetical protein
MPSQDDKERLDRYHALLKPREELLDEFDRDFRPDWQIEFGGKFRIPVRLGSTGFSWLYVGLNIAAFTFGVVSVFLGASWRELGIALIVGSMFAIGAFVGQVWSIQLNTERHQVDVLWRDRFLQEYADRYAELVKQVRLLDSESE